VLDAAQGPQDPGDLAPELGIAQVQRFDLLISWLVGYWPPAKPAYESAEVAMRVASAEAETPHREFIRVEGQGTQAVLR
jgi:hypothetical protein